MGARRWFERRRTDTLEDGQYTVRPTSRSKLREVDFRFEDRRCEGSSKIRIRIRAGHNWHARESKVRQFLSDGRYIANVVDGKLQFYGRRDRARSTTEQKSTTN